MKAVAGFLVILATVVWVGRAISADSPGGVKYIFNPGRLKSTDSRLKVKVGDKAPDFRLRSVGGGEVALGDFRGRKNVLLSFVPAAFTPVCSAQWPGYNLVKDVFDQHNTVLLGITTDNIPSLHAWIEEMGGLWFPVLSDFNPHGKAASAFGVLRSDGTAERALILIDKNGLIRWIDVHDINERPPLEQIVEAMDKLPK